MDADSQMLKIERELYEARKQYALAQANVDRRIRKIRELVIELESISLDLMDIFEPA